MQLTIRPYNGIETTINDVRELLFNNESNEGPYEVGQTYLIRTVTMIQIGRLKSIGQHELVLSDASWIADTGRFHNALSEGVLNEVEPFIDDVIVGRSTVIDATIWRHSLPRKQK